MDYKKSIEICEKALDKINIKDFLIQGEDIRSITKAIEAYPVNDEVINFMSNYPDIFGDPPNILNFMLDYEFLNYCKRRYPEINWGYELAERYWVL